MGIEKEENINSISLDKVKEHKQQNQVKREKRGEESATM